MTVNTHNNAEAPPPSSVLRAEAGLGLLDLLSILAPRRKLLAIGPLAAGTVALGISFLIPPTFTAQTVFVPPQQGHSSASAAMASIGALANLAGGSISGIKTPADQYISLMRSVNVEDRMVDQFKLMDAYDTKYRFLARRQLERNSRITLGKKDGLITVEVDADDPKVAADMANQFVAELRRISGELALTESQQRRAFYEQELKQVRTRLNGAQEALQAGGFSPGALKAEPRTAAEAYARIKAELTSAEVRLQTMRRNLADATPEVQQQVTTIGALRAQLSQLEASTTRTDDADYLGRYREFKYQETLFELFSKQYELARMDESRESAAIQVVDVATPPEYKSKPKRGMIAVTTTFVTFLLLSFGIIARSLWRDAKVQIKARQDLAT